MFAYFKETPEVLTYFVFLKKNSDFHAIFSTIPSDFLVYYNILFLEITDVINRREKYKSPPMRRSLGLDAENIYTLHAAKSIFPSWRNLELDK